MKKRLSQLLLLSGLFVFLIGIASGFAQEAENSATEAGGQEIEVMEEAAPAADEGGINWGIALAILGAAIATFGGGYGSSVGAGIAGEVGDGVLTEDEKKFGSVLVLQALPMTQGIYGLLIAFIIMGKMGPTLTLVDGLGILFAALPIAITGAISGIWQGKVAAASMQLIARKPKQMGQAIVLPVMVETFAVFGLLVSVLMLGQV